MRFRHIIFVLFIVGIIGQLSIGGWGADKLHRWGQTGTFAHEVVMSVDLANFMHDGGGFIGASHNYFGWAYQCEALNPNRPIWKKLLFWPNPYYLTPPPEEWPYSPPTESPNLPTTCAAHPRGARFLSAAKAISSLLHFIRYIV